MGALSGRSTSKAISVLASAERLVGVVWMAALVCGFVRFHAVISSSEVFVTLARHAMQLWFWYMCSEYHESGVGRLFLYWSSSVRWGFAVPALCR